MSLPRYINTFFRHWPIYLYISLLMAGLLVGFSFTIKPKYTTSSTIWVEQSSFLDSQLQRSSSDGSNYDSPANRKANVLSEYMKLRTFVRDVIKGTPYQVYLGDTVKEGDLIKDIMDNYNIKINGYNSFSIQYNYNAPDRSYDITRSIVERFLYEQREEIKRTGQSTISLLKSQIDAAQRTKDSSESNLKDMLSRYPCTTSALSQDRVLSEEDLQCQVLLQKRDTANSNYNSLVNRLSSTEDMYNAALDGKDITLRVVDQPETYEANTNNKLTFLIFGMGGFLVGAVLSVLAIVALTWTDNTVRMRSHAAALFENVKTFELPSLKTTKPRKLRGGQIIQSPDVKQRMLSHLKWAQDDRNLDNKGGAN
ncbi:hypothetical protein [Candidatus Chlorohelix sp.]|uniref:hypothetical protein n=1 Tax=Candidatus Chlorohelix sp. TaxID=3139201 RepID=UPI003035D62C